MECVVGTLGYVPSGTDSLGPEDMMKVAQVCMEGFQMPRGGASGGDPGGAPGGFPGGVRGGDPRFSPSGVPGGFPGGSTGGDPRFSPSGVPEGPR